MLERTYDLEQPPEDAMKWSTYAAIIRNQWNALIERQPPPTEPEVQKFLETHPSMIPGAFGSSILHSGHHPLWLGVISQAPLPSYNKRVPDFMWLSSNSGIEQPVLIEIEDPSKRWFTQAGQQTEHYSSVKSDRRMEGLVQCPPQCSSIQGLLWSY